jgi:hypothetical protein
LLGVAACDPGPATDAPKGVGPVIHVISANVSPTKPLPADGTIELAFDRLLLPESITRQSFTLGGALPALPSYDPVTRVVSITPLAPLIVGQTYELAIVTPTSGTDLSGLRSIDGATIDPKDSVRAFQIVAPGGAGDGGTISADGGTGPQAVDFCCGVVPIFANCNSVQCHGGYLPAAGLALWTNAFVSQTAIGRVAHGSNIGPQAQAAAVGLTFGEDMPIIDPGTGGAGNPGNSWLIYKLLLAHVPPDSGVPTGYPGVAWTPLSESERTILGTFVTGREMPYPGAVTPTPADGLALTDIDTLSNWIAQGAPVPATCPAASNCP